MKPSKYMEVFVLIYDSVKILIFCIFHNVEFNVKFLHFIINYNNIFLQIIKLCLFLNKIKVKSFKSLKNSKSY